MSTGRTRRHPASDRGVRAAAIVTDRCTHPTHPTPQRCAPGRRAELRSGGAEYGPVAGGRATDVVRAAGPRVTGSRDAAGPEPAEVGVTHQCSAAHVRNDLGAK